MNPVRALLIFLIITCILILYVKDISSGFLPDLNSRYITVITECSGYFEEQIEEEITKIMEEELYALNGIIEITSVSEAGKSVILLNVSDYSNFESVYSDVRDRVEKVRHNMPGNAGRPLLLKNSINSYPVFIAFFNSSLNMSKDKIKLLYEKAEGTGEVETGGDKNHEVLIDTDQEILTKYKTSNTAIAGILSKNNVSANISHFSGQPLLYQNRFKNIYDISSTFINHSLKISDTAYVAQIETEQQSYGRYNGKDGVIVYIRKTGDSNTVKLCSILEEITSANNGISVYNHGRIITDIFKETFYSIGAGIILLTASVFIFLKSVYPSFIIILNLFFSLTVAAAAVKAAGFELDMLTLTGLSICAGTVIDSGLIFIDNYMKNPSAAYSSNRILKPIAYSSFTTIAVFLPLFFSSPSLYRLFGSIAVVVSAGITSSFFFTLIFMLPFIKAGRLRSSICSSILIPEKILSSVNKNNTLLFFVIAFILIGLSIISITGFSKELFIPEKSNAVTLFLEFQSGTTLSSVKTRSLQIEQSLIQICNPSIISTKIEKEHAVIVMENNAGDDSGIITSAVENIKQSNNDIFFYIPGGRNNFAESHDSFSVTVTGHDYAVLEEIIQILTENIQKKCSLIIPSDEFSIIYNYKKQLPGIKILIDLNRSDSAGLKAVDIYNNIYTSLSIPVISKWIYNNEENDIKIGSSLLRYSGIEKLKTMTIPGNITGISLSDVASFAEEKRYGNIYHTGRIRSLSFTISAPPHRLSHILKEVNSVIKMMDFPPDYKAEAGKKYNEKLGILNELQYGLILSFTLIFLILIFQFECFKYPVIIIILLLLSLTFPVIFLRLYSKTFTVVSAAGLILSGGISVNSMIIVFESIKQKKNITLEDALYSVNSNFSALFISSLTTILSLLPFIAAGILSRGSIFAPVSIAIASGSAGSVIVVVFYLPLFFKHRPL